MSKTRRAHKDEDGHPQKYNRRHVRTERLKEFEAEYIRKNQTPIITL